MLKIILIILTSVILVQCNSKIDHKVPTSNIEQLKYGFLDPPIEARPRGYWDWLNGNFDYYQLELEMKEQTKAAF